MGLRVEDELVDVQRLLVVAEQQVKVLERLAKEERLHHVARPSVRSALYVAERRVAVLGSCVLFKRLEIVKLFTEFSSSLLFFSREITSNIFQPHS